MRPVSRSILIFACAVFVVFATPPMSKVTIHVTASETGKPVDRASVVIKFVKGRQPMKFYKQISNTWETRTNQEGNAILPPLPQGTMRVQVIAKDYQTFGGILEVDTDPKTLDIKLNPPQPQYTVK